MTRAHAIAALLSLAASSCFIQVVETSTDTGTSGESGETAADTGEGAGTGEDADNLACGDGMRSESEQCDGGDLDDMTCADLGFESGMLACTDACTFDTSMCVGPMSACGDGVAGTDEECDGDDLKGRICESLGFSGGELACGEDCTFDTSGCTEG